MPTGHISSNCECPQGISWQVKPSLKKENVEGARRALALVRNAHRAYGNGNAHRAEREMPTGHIGGHGGKPTGRTDDHMSYGAQYEISGLGMPTGHISSQWESPQGMSWQGKSSLKRKRWGGPRDISAGWECPQGIRERECPQGRMGKCPRALAMGESLQGVLMTTSHMGHNMKY